MNLKKEQSLNWLSKKYKKENSKEKIEYQNFNN